MHRAVEERPTGQIEMYLILAIEHGRRDVWYEAACVRLAGHEDAIILDAENGLPVLKKAEKVSRYISLIAGGDLSHREADRYGLIDPSVDRARPSAKAKAPSCAYELY